MLNFLHTYHPHPILLNLGFLKIYWYGFIIVIAAIIGLVIIYLLTNSVGLKWQEIFNIIFWTIINGLIGARIWHIIMEFPYYLDHPLNTIKVWHGGLGIYGAIIAGLLTVWWLRKKIIISNNKAFWILLDISTPAIALGQAIGRWGNYFNQELYGKPCSMSSKLFNYCLPIDFENRITGYENSSYFIPTFLLESFFCFTLFIFLILLFKHIYKKNIENKYNGLIFLIYILSYSSWRFFIEFLRIDEQWTLFNLRQAQLVSLLVIFISLIIIINKTLIKNKN